MENKFLFCDYRAEKIMLRNNFIPIETGTEQWVHKLPVNLLNGTKKDVIDYIKKRCESVANEILRAELTCYLQSYPYNMAEWIKSRTEFIWDKHENSNEDRWILTDDDCCQLMYKDGKNYYFIEIIEIGDKYGIAKGSIDFELYSKEDIKDAIHTYGYESFDAIDALTNDERESLVAEMLFELESLECIHHYCDSWNKAISKIETITKVDLKKLKKLEENKLKRNQNDRQYPVEAELIVEFCGYCAEEQSFYWNIKKDGYQTFCPKCGQILMLCSICPDADECSFDPNTEDCCQKNKTVWARMGVAFKMTKRQYDDFLRLSNEDDKKACQIIAHLIEDQSFDISGEFYFPEDYDENPDFEINLIDTSVIDRAVKSIK